MLLSLLLVLFPMESSASDMVLRTSVHEKSSNISVAFENAQYTVEDGKISGSGVRGTFYHAINDSFGAELGISAAVNTQGEVQNSFTGFTGFAYYNLFGRQNSKVKKTYLADVLISAETEPSNHNLLLGAGLGQYFFNGNKGVYSASGIGIGAIYKFNVWGLDFKVSARWSQLSAAQTNVNALAVDAGIVFSL